MIEFGDGPALELGPVVLIDSQGATGWMPDGSSLDPEHPVWRVVQEKRRQAKNIWDLFSGKDYYALITWRTIEEKAFPRNLVHIVGLPRTDAFNLNRSESAWTHVWELPLTSSGGAWSAIALSGPAPDSKSIQVIASGPGQTRVWKTFEGSGAKRQICLLKETGAQSRTPKAGNSDFVPRQRLKILA